jgi:hypothetical protein
MPTAALAVIWLAVGLYAMVAPLRRALVCLLAITVLVPAPMLVANPLSTYLTVHRLVLAAVGLNLLARAAQGQTRPGSARPTAVHLPLLALAAVAMVNGVALAPATQSFPAEMHLASVIIDQGAFFVIVLALLRVVDDDWFAVRAIAGVLGVSCLVALGEHVTSHSWGHFLLSSSHGSLDAGRPLQRRGQHLRVRAGAEFALQFAWMTAALSPFLLLATSRRIRHWRTMSLLAGGAASLAIIWSYSRTALPGLVIAIVTMWLLSGFERRIGTLLVAGLLAGAAVVALSPGITGQFSRQADQGSITARTDRLPVLLGHAAQHPVTGLGGDGTTSVGFPTADSSYLYLYVDYGATGEAVFVVLLLTGLVCAARGLKSRRRDTRLLAAAAVASAVASIVSALALDSFTLGASGRIFWLAVAMGVAVAERDLGPARLRLRPTVARVGAVVLALAGGLAIAAAAPSSRVATFGVETLPSRASAPLASSVPSSVATDALTASACELTHRSRPDLPRVKVVCRPVAQSDIATMRIEAPTASRLDAAVVLLSDRLAAALPGSRFDLIERATSRPTATSTAPWWLLIAALAVVLSVPSRGAGPRRDPGPRRGTGRMALEDGGPTLPAEPAALLRVGE